MVTLQGSWECGLTFFVFRPYKLGTIAFAVHLMIFPRVSVTASQSNAL